ncbi:MAG: lipocalin family protein [Desulfomonilaceae bacterium]
MNKNCLKYSAMGMFYSLLLIFVISCQSQSADTSQNTQGARIVGTWIMTSRIIDGEEVPVKERVMKLVLNSDGTFIANYRGEINQEWILSGQGAFSYDPPTLNLYWDTGRLINLLVDESQPDRLVLHHGKNIAPLKDQEPDEVFLRFKGEKGPTR